MAINKVDLDQLLNQARVKLVGASDGGLKGEFYDVVSEFLNDSSSWTQDVTVAYQAGVTSYPLFVPEGQIIRLNGTQDWGTQVPQQGQRPQNGSFMPALMPEIGQLCLAHAPNVAGYMLVSLVCNVALPTDKNLLPQAPQWLLPVWHVGLLDGILGKMMAQPQKSYTNSTQAAYHLKRFRDAIARARTSKLRANTVGSAAWRFPQQFRSVSQQGGVPAVGSASERSF